MSELKDSFKRLFIFYGRSEKEAERMAELAAEPPLGYRWSKVNAKPKAKPYAVKETKPKLSRAEADARFYQVKRGDAGPKIRMTSAGESRTVELREDTGEVTGCIVAVGGKEVAR